MTTATARNPEATCATCPMSEQIPGSTTKMHCKLNPPIPIISNQINHQNHNQSEYRYRWVVPETDRNSFCAQHPDILKS